MNHRVLEHLLSAEFDAEVGFILPTPALRHRLQRLDSVLSVRHAIARGEVREEAFKAFVSQLLGEFKSGERLPGDLALATLAVACERNTADFVEHFLTRLASLRLEELPIASSIAREVMRFRAGLPKTQKRSASYAKFVRQKKVACTKPMRVVKYSSGNVSMSQFRVKSRASISFRGQQAAIHVLTSEQRRKRSLQIAP